MNAFNLFFSFQLWQAWQPANDLFLRTLSTTKRRSMRLKHSKCGCENSLYMNDGPAECFHLPIAAGTVTGLLSSNCNFWKCKNNWKMSNFLLVLVVFAGSLMAATYDEIKENTNNDTETETSAGPVGRMIFSIFRAIDMAINFFYIAKIVLVG